MPETARWLAGNLCADAIPDKDTELVCACSLNSVAADMQSSSMPNRHKEIVQQTDWQYLRIDGNDQLVFPSGDKQNRYGLYQNQYASSFICSIFHPPSRA